MLIILLVVCEYFDRNLIQKIDSSTTLAVLNKTIQAYDSGDTCIYAYSDLAGDTLAVSKSVLDDARIKNHLYL